ncbi:sugar transferase [Algoriphagus halophilus]|uniref:sugar transferase n=1 Tax=Algoriphagus halophilus TaxID=226505 RepID=UPI00358F1396
MDILISFLMLVALSPVFILLYLVLGVYYRSSPIFSQVRPGLNGKLFYILKFKTMNDAYDESGFLLPDNQRINPLGKWVRASSLDEIPQLINVLKGEMSMIGPRPLLREYLYLYSEEQSKRHEVRPGVTGWAQINGRNAISWEKKFEYDVEYVTNCSFQLDMRILFETFFNVLAGKGITQKGHVSSEKFRGSPAKRVVNNPLQ